MATTHRIIKRPRPTMSPVLVRFLCSTSLRSANSLLKSLRGTARATATGGGLSTSVSYLKSKPPAEGRVIIESVSSVVKRMPQTQSQSRMQRQRDHPERCWEKCTRRKSSTVLASLEMRGRRILQSGVEPVRTKNSCCWTRCVVCVHFDKMHRHGRAFK